MGILSDLNRSRKKATKKILNPFVKAAGKISDKLIPNELRWAMPYAAGIGTLMLPPGMSPLMRAMSTAGLNVAGQIAADETPIEDISDINALSVALAGGLGALGSDRVADSMRSGIERGMGTGVDQFGDISVPYTDNVGFLQGAENVGREGLAAASDYITGGREALVDIGRNPGSLFEYNKTNLINKAPGLTKAASALGPTIAHGTGDVFHEAAIDYKDEADRLQAEEEAEIAETTTADETKRATLQMEFMRQGGHDEETIKETLAQNNLEDYYVAPEAAAQGGIIGLKNGGSLNAKRGLVDGPGGYAGRNLGDILQHGWWYPKIDSEPFNQIEYDEKLKKAEQNLQNYGESDRNFEVDMFGKTQKRLQEDGLEFGDAVGKAEIINYYQYGKGALEGETYQGNDPIILEYLGMTKAKGGIIGLKNGGMLNLGGNEMDYRGGGFVPIGKKERADDVPARLSKNEFVMTADAVKAAGGGSVNKGAQRMYNVMNNLEARA